MVSSVVVKASTSAEVVQRVKSFEVVVRVAVWYWRCKGALEVRTRNFGISATDAQELSEEYINYFKGLNDILYSEEERVYIQRLD